MRFFFAAFFLCMFFSCASNSKDIVADFYEENIADFKEFSLSNGIPVAIKNTSSAKNIELRILFEGGGSDCPRGKSGLDLLAFELVACGPAVKELSAHAKYFPVAICENDFCACGFSAPADFFYEALSAFADSILNANFSHEDYLKKEMEAKSRVLDQEEKTSFALLSLVRKNVLKNHPYEEGIFYAKTTRASEDDVRTRITSLLNAARMKIVVAGNFCTEQDGEKKSLFSKEEKFLQNALFLQNRLEELFAQIEKKEFLQIQIPPVNLAQKNDAKLSFEFALSSYYAALCFKCPARGSADYEAFALCTLALDFALRREVVEKECAALSCAVAVLNGKESLALIVATGINKEQNTKQIILDAIKTFPSCDELEAILPRFKNIYASKIFSSVQNEYASLEQMTSSIFYEDGAAAYLKRSEKIQNTTAKEVFEAYEKYFLCNECFFAEVKN